MKKLSLFAISLVVILVLASCGGPKADVKKMLKKFEDYTEVAEEAVEDKILDEKEIKELNEISAEIDEFSKEMDEKYEEDDAATKEMEEFMKEEKNKEILKKYTDALMSLWDCEGAENLE